MYGRFCRPGLRRLLSWVVTATMILSLVPSEGVTYALAGDDVPAVTGDVGASGETDARSEEEVPEGRPEEGAPEQANDEADTGASEDEQARIERVTFTFDANAPPEEAVTGEMPDVIMTLDGESHALPGTGFSCEGREFLGWSVTADGRPHEGFDDAGLVSDGREMTDLAWDEADGDGTRHRSLEGAVRDGIVRLYAQWSEKSEESKSEESKPEESKSDELKSDESKSDESKSDESKSDESKSDESKSDGSKSDESKSDESKSEESKPEESKSDESKSDESKSDESKSEESKPEESKSDESKSDESKSDESKSDESKSDESKPEKSKSEESKSDESKSDESESEESKPEESKSEESKSKTSKDGKSGNGSSKAKGGPTLRAQGDGDPTTYVVLRADGSLVMVRAASGVTDGEGSVTDANGATYAGYVRDLGDRPAGGRLVPDDKVSSVMSFSVAPGTTVTASGCESWFHGFTNMVTADLRGIDLSGVDGTDAYLFNSCSSLREVNMSGTHDAGSGIHVFFGCDALERVTLDAGYRFWGQPSDGYYNNLPSNGTASFSGKWHDASVAGSPAMDASQIGTLASDGTWERVPWQITYFANGGTGSMDSEPWSELWVAPECTFGPARGTTTFFAWQHNMSTYLEPGDVFPGGTGPGRDVTLKATWTSMIRYSYPEDAQGPDDEPYDLSSGWVVPDATRSGHFLEGWQLYNGYNEDLGMYAPGTTTKGLGSEVSAGDLRAVAVWGDSMTYLVLEDGGNLVMVASTDDVASGTGTVTDADGVGHTGTVWRLGVRPQGGQLIKDAEARAAVRSFSVAPGPTIYPCDCNSWFSGFSNMVTADLTGVSLDQLEPDGYGEYTKGVSYMFSGCSSLRDLDLSEFVVPNRLDYLDGTFDGCISLERVALHGSFPFVNREFEQVLLPDNETVVLTGRWRNTSVDGSPELTPTAVIGYSPRAGVWERVKKVDAYEITFEGAEGTFSDGTRENVVRMSPFNDHQTRYAHSSNISDAGVRDGDYSRADRKWTTVTIPGATTLHVSLRYQFGSYYTELLVGTQESLIGTQRFSGTYSQTRTFDISGDTVSFYFNVGTSDPGSYGYYATVSADPVGYDDGGAYEEPTPDDAGSWFLWWECDGVRVDDWQELREDATLVATYGSPRVSFDANEGTGSMDPVDLKEGTLVPACEFEAPVGLWFREWNTEADGSGTSYQEGDEIPVGKDDLTLYAQWYGGDAYAVLTDDGELVFFRSTGRYQSGSDQTVTDVMGNTYEGRVFTNVESTSTSTAPWYSFGSQILSARVADGQTISPRSMAGWFRGTKVTGFDMSSLDLSYVTTMYETFGQCPNLTSVSLSGLDMPLLTTANYLFDRCSNLTSADLSDLSAPSLTSVESMFSGCSNLVSLDLGDLEIAPIERMSSMFSGCTSIESLDLSSLDVSRNLASSSNVFYNCNSLMSVTLGEGFRFGYAQLPSDTSVGATYSDKWRNVTVDGAMPVTSDALARNYDGSSTEGDYARGTYVRQPRGNTYAVLTDDGDLVYCNSVEEHAMAERGSVTDVMGNVWTGVIARDVDRSAMNWRATGGTGTVKRVYVAEGSTYWAPFSLSQAFAGCGNLESVDLSGFDTSDVISMSEMFSNCTKLSDVSMDGIDTSNVTDTSSMFSACMSLESVDLSGWDTHRLTDASSMFSACVSLDEVKGVEFLDVRSLQNIDRMFWGCPLDSLDLRGWRPLSLRSANDAFRRVGEVDTSGWFAPMLPSNSLASSFSGSDAPSTWIGRGMRVGQSVGVHTSELSVHNNGREQAGVVDLSDSSFYDVTGVGFNNNGLSSIDLSGCSFPEVTTFYMNNNSRLESVGLDNLSIPKVTKMGFVSNYDLKSRDRSSVEVGSLTDLGTLASGCTSLTYANLAGLDTSGVTSMSGMFSNCKSLVDVRLDDIDTSSVTSMNGMFSNCSSLASLDISSFDTSSVTSMEDMFSGADSLQRLVLGEDFAFVGDDSLPVPDWVRKETGELVEDLWHEYDGATMAGTYVRARVIVDDDDVFAAEHIDDVTYDPSTGEVVIYLKTDVAEPPVPVLVPALREYLSVHEDVLRQNSQLRSLLNDVVAGRTELPDLHVSVRNVMYADVTSCVTSSTVLFTMNVPKAGIGPVRIDLWRAPKEQPDPFDYGSGTYVGYIENSVEEPDVFRHYDADGELIEEMHKGELHTRGVVWGVDQETYERDPEYYDEPLLVPYEQYDTYRSAMDHYEFMTMPGRYRMVVSTPGNSDLAVSSVSRSGEGLKYYDLQVGGSSDGEFLTFFNDIEPQEYDVYSNGYVGVGLVRKVNAKTGEGVFGAVYRLRGEHGQTYYAMTGMDGTIRPIDTVTQVAYDTWRTTYGTQLYEDEALTRLVTRPSIDFDEEFDVVEVRAPSGYYINDEHVSVVFVHRPRSWEKIGTAVAWRSDGVAMDPDEESHDCLTCATVGHMCLCNKYRGHQCVHCGNPSPEVVKVEEVAKTSDMPHPKVYVTKQSDEGSSVVGARLQILDGTTVIDEWVTEGSQYGAQTHAFAPGEGEHGVANGQAARTFTLHEVSVPEGYLVAEDVDFELGWDSGTISVNMTDPVAREVRVTKAWDPAPPAGARVTLALRADGDLTGDTVTLDGTPDDDGEESAWVAVFKGLRKYRTGGSFAGEVDYDVVESSTWGAWGPADGAGVAEDGGTITNVEANIWLPASGLTPGHAAMVCGLAALVCGAVVTLERQRRALAEAGTPGRD